MSTEGTPKRETPWQFQPLPPDHLHPLTFLRPDVVLHVHDLWKSGRHNETTYRTFSLPDVTNFRPFLMMGGFACVDYLKDWRITPQDVERLRGLESLAELPAAFWDYLTSIPHFTGSMKALPDGQLMGDRPIEVSPEVREMHGDAKVELDLVGVEGPSAEVALISEAFAAIIDFSIAISADQVAHKRAGLAMMYYETERELHPYWARLAATIESIIANDNPLNKRLHKIWLWSDGIRDPDMPARTHRAMNDLEAQGYDTGVLSRKEIAR
jgi:hypothetical protein